MFFNKNNFDGNKKNYLFDENFESNQNLILNM